MDSDVGCARRVAGGFWLAAGKRAGAEWRFRRFKVAGFPKRERLRSSKAFREVFERCRRWKSEDLALYVQRNGPGTRRFGVSVGRSFGRAVARNRFKRRLREIYRREKDFFKEGYRVVVVPQRRTAELSFEELYRSFKNLAQKAGLYLEEKKQDARNKL